MKARFINWRGLVCVSWLDSQGEGLPVEIHQRAWRRCTYRAPLFDTKRAPLPIADAGTAKTNPVLMTTRFE